MRNQSFLYVLPILTLILRTHEQNATNADYQISEEIQLFSNNLYYDGFFEEIDFNGVILNFPSFFKYINVGEFHEKVTVQIHCYSNDFIFNTSLSKEEGILKEYSKDNLSNTFVINGSIVTENCETRQYAFQYHADSYNLAMSFRLQEKPEIEIYRAFIQEKSFSSTQGGDHVHVNTFMNFASCNLSCFQNDFVLTKNKNSLLKYCSDEDCSEILEYGNIYQNATIYLLQEITHENLINLKFLSTRVFFISKEGFFIDANSSSTYEEGRIIITINVSNGWIDFQLSSIAYFDQQGRPYEFGAVTENEYCVEQSEEQRDCVSCEILCQMNSGRVPTLCQCSTFFVNFVSGQKYLSQFVLLIFIIII